MENLKLISVLQTFSKNEIKAFEKFISSPYFTPGLKISPKALSMFYRILISYFPEFSGTGFTKQKIFEKIYPGIKYKDEVFRNLCSVTLRLAEDFIVQQTFAEYPYQRERFLLKGLRERKLNFNFERVHRKTMAVIAENPYDSELYLVKHEIELEKALYLLNNNKQAMAKDAVSKQMELLCSYFMNYVTNNLYLWRASREAFSTKPGFDITEEFVRHFDYKSFVYGLKNVSPEISHALEYEYLKTMMLLLKQDTSYFYSLKKLLKNHPEYFNKDTKLSLYYKLLAYCIENLNVNTFKFLKEEFKLYREILNENLGLETKVNGYFPLHHFRNIILTATELKENRWLESFLIKYTDFIVPELKTEIREYGNAFLLYSKKNYGKALEHAVRINYRHHVIQTDIMILRLKIYYQLGYIEEALYLTDSFRHYLVNNKSMSEDQKTVHMSFANYLNRIIKYNDKGNLAGLNSLENKISQDYKVSNKYWLLEKVNEVRLKNQGKITKQRKLIDMNKI